MSHAIIAERIVGALQNRISEYEQMTNSFLSSDASIPAELKERYETIGNITEGLHEAMCIVLRGEYMDIDVDLTGGEDIDD